MTDSLATVPVASARLEHPGIIRAVGPDGRIAYVLLGTCDCEVATVLKRLVSADLLAHRDAKKPARLMLDLADAGHLDGRALEVLREMTQLVHGEPGTGLVFANVNDGVRAQLEAAGFGKCFPIASGDEVERKQLPEMRL